MQTYFILLFLFYNASFDFVQRYQEATIPKLVFNLHFLFNHSLHLKFILQVAVETSNFVSFPVSVY